MLWISTFQIETIPCSSIKASVPSNPLPKKAASMTGLESVLVSSL